MPNPTTAAEWVRTVPLDCPHPEARELYVCYECAAANLDAYARQRVEAALERAARLVDAYQKAEVNNPRYSIIPREIAAAIRALEP